MPQPRARFERGKRQTSRKSSGQPSGGADVAEEFLDLALEHPGLLLELGRARSAPGWPRRRSPARFRAAGRCWSRRPRCCARRGRCCARGPARRPTAGRPPRRSRPRWLRAARSGWRSSAAPRRWRAVVSWIARICPATSSVALPVCVASSLTSAATTAKPRPASPPRAASIEALSASRLVRWAMVEIISTMSPTWLAESVSAEIVVSASSAALEALRASSAEVEAWRLISPIDMANSSLAAAAAVTPAEASLRLDETSPVCIADCSAAEAIELAVACSWLEAAATPPTMSPTVRSNLSASADQRLGLPARAAPRARSRARPCGAAPRRSRRRAPCGCGRTCWRPS